MTCFSRIPARRATPAKAPCLRFPRISARSAALRRSAPVCWEVALGSAIVAVNDVSARFRKEGSAAWRGSGFRYADVGLMQQQLTKPHAAPRAPLCCAALCCAAVLCAPHPAAPL